MPSNKSDNSKSQSLAPRASLLKKYKYNNPYVNFLIEFLSQSDNRCLGTQTELFRIAGRQWRHMSDGDRAPFIECALYNKAHNKQPKRRKVKIVCSYCGHLTKAKKKKSKQKDKNNCGPSRRDGDKLDLQCESPATPPANQQNDVDDMFETESAMSSVSSF